MDKAVVAQKSPIAVEVEEGKSYYWCSCGLSASQPFCDGSHKETSFTPTKYDADASGTKHFCACKATGNQPLCDGAHNSLD
jgi:CDGSH iron-sulfur domain-containing protein 3